MPRCEMQIKCYIFTGNLDSSLYYFNRCRGVTYVLAFLINLYLRMHGRRVRRIVVNDH